MICKIAENIFHSNGKPKQKVLPMVLKEFKKTGVSIKTAVKDAYEGGRALLW
jgi:hypothetical protein